MRLATQSKHCHRKLFVDGGKGSSATSNAVFCLFPLLKLQSTQQKEKLACTLASLASELLLLLCFFTFSCVFSNVIEVDCLEKYAADWRLEGRIFHQPPPTSSQPKLQSKITFLLQWFQKLSCMYQELRCSTKQTRRICQSAACVQRPKGSNLS